MANPNPKLNPNIKPGKNRAKPWPKGVSPNPGGISKLRAEYEAFRSKLFDPEIRDKAFDVLKRAVIKEESWAVNRWFDLAIKVLPAPPQEVTVQADLTVSRKEQDAQLEFIAGELAKYAAVRATASNLIEAGPRDAEVQLEVLGEKGPTRA